MTVLTANSKSVIDQKAEPSSGNVRLNVTGVDVKGQMFRHPATVVALDGRDCVFRSDSQPELDGSVLAEFNYEGASPQNRVSQARVKSNLSDPQGGYRVVVELEFAQTAKVNLPQTEARPVIQKPVVVPVHPAAKTPVESKIAAFPVPPPAPWEIPVAAKVSEPVLQKPAANGNDIPQTQSDKRSMAPKVSPVDIGEVEERLKSAMLEEIRQEMSVLKNSISNEIENALPALVTSKMEKMIREDVEKQVQSSYESSVQSLHSDVEKQVLALADGPDLQAAFQNNAKRFFEERAAEIQSASIKAGDEIASRASAMMRPFEESLAAMEARMNASRAEMESAAAGMEKMKVEINQGLLLIQDALQELRDVEKPGIEKMQSHAEAQLKDWSTQFDNLLNKSATEKAIQFSLDMERRMAPHRQRADESVEKLGAMLQLLQGTARVQQERLNEHSIAAAANFEKQIKAFLVRLGGGE
ncbi:MAG TPA: hypothetical protein VK709_21560 [Candidatus Saccharimonadales bacterium]|nr:hypothetical protein [Candidatus Saccharimonadales bacterium]